MVSATELTQIQRAVALFHLGIAQLVAQRAGRLADPVEGG